LKLRRNRLRITGSAQDLRLPIAFARAICAVRFALGREQLGSLFALASGSPLLLLLGGGHLRAASRWPASGRPSNPNGTWRIDLPISTALTSRPTSPKASSSTSRRRHVDVIAAGQDVSVSPPIKCEDWGVSWSMA